MEQTNFSSSHRYDFLRKACRSFFCLLCVAIESYRCLDRASFAFQNLNIYFTVEIHYFWMSQNKSFKDGKWVSKWFGLRTAEMKCIGSSRALYGINTVIIIINSLTVITIYLIFWCFCKFNSKETNSKTDMILTQSILRNEYISFYLQHNTHSITHTELRCFIEFLFLRGAFKFLCVFWILYWI